MIPHGVLSCQPFFKSANIEGINQPHDAGFFAAILALLDGHEASLPESHTYAAALAAIKTGVAETSERKAAQHDTLPFDAELIPHSVAVLLGGPQEKMAYAQYLMTQTVQATDEDLKALLNVIQLALFSTDLSQLGRDLRGVYREAWETIAASVEAGGVDPRLFEVIARKSPYNLMEGHFAQVMIVNAEHLKRVPGHKTDQKDAEWIAELLQLGLLKASFIPPRVQRELRQLTRLRTTLTQERTRLINRVHKLLEDANFKLSSVLTDIRGQTGKHILGAVVRGEEDPTVLANMALRRAANKRDALVLALRGRVSDHHRLLEAQNSWR